MTGKTCLEMFYCKNKHRTESCVKLQYQVPLSRNVMMSLTNAKKAKKIILTGEV